MKLAINNHFTGNIEIYNIPAGVDIKDSESVENFISSVLEYGLSNIDYIVFNKIIELN